jgi:hypothetical protein
MKAIFRVAFKWTRMEELSTGGSVLLRGAVNNLHNPRCSPSTSRAIEKSKDIYFLPGIVTNNGHNH